MKFKSILFLFVALLVCSWPVWAQEGIKVISNTHDHIFKKTMTFALEVSSEHEIDSIKLFYRVSGQTSSHKVELEFTPAKQVSVSHTEDLSDPKKYFAPMIEFTYWWLVTDTGGNRLKTEPITFVYLDTNYTWQVLENELVRLYWHDQDQDFGQHYFDLAVASARSLHDEFGVETPQPVQIVIYNSHRELMDVLQEGSAEWTGAVTFFNTGCIAIGLGPRDWMDKVIPHELTHATLYMITKQPFGDIPRWLHEGLAMRSEGGMSIEERSVLNDAIRKDTLISLRALNSGFPDDRERAILSYAQSYSLIDFIIQRYGTEKLGELINVFAIGAHYDDALTRVFGVDMDGMEDLWREHIGAKPRQGVTQTTPVPTDTPKAGAMPTPGTLSTPEPGAETPVPPSTTPSVIPAPASRPCCCPGALPALGLLVLFMLFRPRPSR